MSNERLPKHLPEGKRSTGGQRKRYNDSLKSSLKAFEINNGSWESLAAERGTRHSHIRKAAGSYEQTRIRHAEERRLLHNASAAGGSSAVNTDLQCPNCDRTFRALIGLISHIRTHRLLATDQLASPDGWTNTTRSG